MEAAQERKSRAEAFRKELLLGITSTKEVIAWADGIVAAEDEPHISVIELSMAVGHGPWEIADLLKAIPGEPSPDLVKASVFRRLRDVLRERPGELRRFGSIFLSLASEGFAPSEDATGEMYMLEDRLELARGGIFGDLDEIRKDTQEFLDRVCR
jgi:hypothetical protein